MLDNMFHGKLLIKVLHNPLLPFRYESWNIGVIYNYSQSDLLSKNCTDIAWLPPLKGGYFRADPFITDYFGNTTVFFENYDMNRGLGNISYFELNDDKGSINLMSSKMIHKALEEATHLSFPYLFEYQENLYMVPENYQSNKIRFYVSENSPAKWRECACCIENFPGIDPIIFEYDGIWWLFATPYDEDNNISRTNLHIWYSETPLGKWKEHPLNPIIYSEPIARNGGRPILMGDTLYRLSQDCTNRYGEKLVINKIIKLTPTEFKEEVVSKLGGYKPYDEAFHTFNSCKNISVIDGNRYKYSIRTAIQNAKNLLRK
ncbi:glucosamine inositolphosphorylceramide transferase family protein [Methanomicrobium mobile]|uniref:glucosamine inositolphosphorylceramide transferase family protein n=1 Tax=Methanomicrobium mobile TaxID=2205 RepID=UPI0005B28DB3|nr:hypothetical protein [Methanomicrobium mobile]